MKTEAFHFELITPCFCGGAAPDTQAEIRAPSIRGQLRWWFRTLGGFKSLSPTPVREQEAMVFGSINGCEGRASQLVVRVRGISGSRLISTQAKDAEGMNGRVGTDRGYLLFPLRNRPRGVFDESSLPKFDLNLVWRGDPLLWKSIRALVTIFGNLGALGFRSRRAMGALSMSNAPMLLQEAFSYFSDSSLLQVRGIAAKDGTDAIRVLASWLKGWRAHGRTGNNTAEQSRPGFKFAKNDHDSGLPRSALKSYRPAIGLPIIQRYSSGNTNNWDFGAGNHHQPKGRFASPVLLRPHRDAQGNWRGLVIFVEPHKWPNDPATGQPRKVFLNGQPRSVSLDLYEAMKNDLCLKPFLG
jgi:CRISPR type III-B/RAMP module RAMP protein Cmr1